MGVGLFRPLTDRSERNGVAMTARKNGSSNGSSAMPPERVFVNSTPWTIHFVNETKMRERNVGDDNVVGCTFQQSLEILIGDWTPEYVQRRTLLHELMHAAWSNMACVALGKDGQVETEHVEETVISGLEQGMFSALHDNPGLVAWLCGQNGDGSV